MRILFVTPFLPDSRASHGGGVYLASLARALAARTELGIATFARALDQPSRSADGDVPWQWRAELPLEPRPRGAARVTHQLRMAWRWRRLPLVAAKHWHAGMPATLERACREFRPDVAFVELAQMAQYLPWLTQVPTVLTDHEAGCPANTATGLGRLGDRRDVRLWRAYVRHFYSLASLVQAVTAEDAASLAQQLGREVLVRPPTYALPEAPVSPEAAPPRALFLGDFSHGPNPEAAAALVHDVLPRLRQAQPDVELWLAGPHPERIAALASTPGVRVLGYVPDLHRLFADVRLMLAPLWSGGGFRMKSLSALAHGVPVVTNALGARGCDAPPPARTVAEGAEALAAAALVLLRSPADAARAGRAAFAWAKGHLAADAVAAAQIERAQRLLATVS